MAGDMAKSCPFGLDISQAVCDRATRIAKTLFGALDAQVVFVSGDEVWRSRDPDRRVVQDVAPVAVQVCEKGEVLWVSDAPADPEFRNNPSVVGAPFLRFYAAAPIKLADGSSPGILAVGGREPKPYEASR